MIAEVILVSTMQVSRRKVERWKKKQESLKQKDFEVLNIGLCHF